MRFVDNPSRRWSALVVVLACAIGPEPVGAGDEVEAPAAAPVTGTIAGHVRFPGEVPAPAALHAHHDPEVCGDGLVDESLRVGAEGALAGAVVVLQGVPAEARTTATGATATLDQQTCTFVPHVQSVTQGTTLRITSSDPVLHNVHAFLGKRTAFNLAIPVAGKVVERTLDEPGVMRIRCDSGHTWMSAYVAVVAHRFHATTGADGSFQLDEVPPGDYVLRAWHERLGVIEHEVHVSAGERAAVELKFKDLDDEATEPAPARADAELRAALEATRSAVQLADDRRRADERDRLAREGRPLFVKYCATCHGKKGDGRGPSARFTTTPPRDFTRGTYKFRMSPVGAPPSLDDLVRTIRVGVRGTHMPAWKGKLKRTQIETIARYLTTLSDVFWTDTPAPPPLVIPAETPYDDASVARGKDLFGRMQCATCHGAGGAGDGPAASSLRDDWGKPIKPADLTAGVFKGGCCGAVVYRAISTGLGGTPMPSFAGAMSEAERWDLAHYVLSLGQARPAVDYLLHDPAGRMTPP